MGGSTYGSIVEANMCFYDRHPCTSSMLLAFARPCAKKCYLCAKMCLVYFSIPSRHFTVSAMQ